MLSGIRLEHTVKKRRRQILPNAVLVLASVLLAFALFEVGIRVYSDFVYPKMMVWDENLGWRHASNVRRTFVNEIGESALVVLNAFGNRGSAPTSEKRADRRRILTLGDSFTEGVQVSEEHLFTARMEMADPRLEVINTGVGGYGTVQEYIYLASEGLRLNPDLVLLMFFENDLTDNALSYYPSFGPRPYARLEQEQLQIVETLDSSEQRKYILPFPFRDTLNRHSYFYYFVNSRIYQRIFADPLRKMQQADLGRINDETRYKIFDEVLGRIVRLLDQKKIPFLMVIIPSREETLDGRFEVGEVVGNLANIRGLDHLSLLDRFHSESSSGAKLYFDEDMHWTKDGHRVAADEVLKRLHSVQEIHLTDSEAPPSHP